MGQGGAGGWRRWVENDRLMALAVGVVALVYYALITPLDLTFGDGPELLVAAHNGGVSHPSGYPLFTLLGMGVCRLPGATPFFHMALWLSALPTAAAASFLYLTARHLRVAQGLALGAALAWAFSRDVVYQATRIEIYGLHCLFVVLALWSLTGFARTRRPVWIMLAVGSVCLGLTNHLTTAFLIVPVMLGLTLVDFRLVFTVRRVAAMAGIAAACATVYAYLPLAAMAADGDAIVWNDPQTMERFVFHVTGGEYSIFRSDQGLWPPLRRFGQTVSGRFFPGALVVVAAGLVFWGRTQWRTMVAALGYAVCLLVYISTFDINDIATYYTSLYILVALGLGLGGQGLLHAVRRWPRAGQPLTAALLAAGLGLSGYLAVTSWQVKYWERLAGDLSTAVMTSLKDPAILFTSVDGHTFPMWYQSLVVAPERRVVVVDRVLFHLENKQWYRDWLRQTYPEVVWPDDAVATGGKWDAELVRNNPRHHIAALLHRPWRVPGSYSVPAGWHHDIRRGRRKGPVPVVKHVYSARAARTGAVTRFHRATGRYHSGEDEIACVAEWHSHAGFEATWTFIGPSGQRVVVGPRNIPRSAGSSWEFLPPDKQAPGVWRCEITSRDRPLLVTPILLEAP